MYRKCFADKQFILHIKGNLAFTKLIPPIMLIHVYTTSEDVNQLTETLRAAIKGLDTGKASPYLPGTIANPIFKFTVMTLG